MKIQVTNIDENEQDTIIPRAEKKHVGLVGAVVSSHTDIFFENGEMIPKQNLSMELVENNFKDLASAFKAGWYTRTSFRVVLESDEWVEVLDTEMRTIE